MMIMTVMMIMTKMLMKMIKILIMMEWMAIVVIMMMVWAEDVVHASMFLFVGVVTVSCDLRYRCISLQSCRMGAWCMVCSSRAERHSSCCR
jgi:hypothetical protein